MQAPASTLAPMLTHKHYTNFNKVDFNSHFYMFFETSFLTNTDPYMFINSLKLLKQKIGSPRQPFPDVIIRDSESVTDFTHMRQSTVISFFVDNMVDVPVCFKKSKSLYAVTFELQSLKCINFLTRHGRREQMFKFFNTALNNIITTNRQTLFPQTGTNSWHLIYKILSKLFVTGVNAADKVVFGPTFKDFPSLVAHQAEKENLRRRLIAEGRGHELKSEKIIPRLGAVDWVPNIHQTFMFQRSFYYDNKLYFNPLYFTKTILFNLIKKFSPLFTFYVRKVDKKIRKNSRGKSGKYVIVWKYIPEYKRFYLALRWFLKDLKFYRERTVVERLIKAIYTLLVSPNQTFLAKLRKFSHIFVFQNFKKTLMKTLKATS